MQSIPLQDFYKENWDLFQQYMKPFRIMGSEKNPSSTAALIGKSF